MKKHAFLHLLQGTLLAALSLSYLWGQSSEVIPLRSFESVVIHPGFDVEFVLGSQPAIEIQSYGTDPAYIHAYVSQHTLEVYHHNFRPPWNNQVRGHWDDRLHAKLIITYTYLDAIDYRGSGRVICHDELDAETFRLKLYGDGEVYIPHFRTGLLQAALYGDIRLTAGGQAYEQRWRSYGDVSVDAYELRGEFADVKLYGDSEVLLDIRDELALTVFGDGVIRYKGSPSIRRRLVLGEASLLRQH
jgi:hypothetical protein